MDDLAALERDLDALSFRASNGIRTATAKAAKAAAGKARQAASGSRFLPHYPRSITHEVSTSQHEVVGEVGVAKGGQGSLGHLIEHGSATSRPHLHVNQAVEGETPGWMRDLLSAVRL